MNKAFSTLYNISETLGESDETGEDTEVYAPEEQVQNQKHEPEMEEEPQAYVPEPEIQVSLPVEVAPAMRTSGRTKNKPE